MRRHCIVFFQFFNDILASPLPTKENTAMISTHTKNDTSPPLVNYNWLKKRYICIYLLGILVFYHEYMSLTKKDLGLIADLFSQLFSKEFVKFYDQVLYPHFERLENRIEKVEDRLDDLETKSEERFFDLKDQIDDNTKLIGYYFEKCSTKEEVNALSLRVTTLEPPQAA